MNNDWLDDARKIPDEPMGYIRKLAVRAVVESGFRPSLVATMFNVSPSSLYDWIKRYERGGYDFLESRNAPGAEPVITPEMDSLLRDIVVKENPTDYGYDTQLWTCQIIANIIHKTFGVKVLASTVHVHLKKLGLSFQKPRYVAREQDPAQIKHFLNEKFPRIQRLADRLGADIAFEDEAGVDLTERAGRTWGLVGKTPTVIASGQRGKLNVLSLVTKDGTLEYDVTAARINSDTYIEFLEDVLEGRGRPLVLLLDSASFHHSKSVRNFVRLNRKRIRVFFLPKYSPEYNPAEQVWEEIKDNQIGRQPVYTKGDLKKKLLSALKCLQQNTARIKSFFELPHTRYALT
jgi:transposase